MCIAQITCYLLPVASQETEQEVGISSTSWKTTLATAHGQYCGCSLLWLLGLVFFFKLVELFFIGLSLTFLLYVSAIFSSQYLNKHRKSKANHNIYTPFEGYH